MHQAVYGFTALLLHCRATTHSDLWLRAKQRNIPVQIIHNASVMNAVGACGLQLYRFGEVRMSAWQCLGSALWCRVCLAVSGVYL